MQRRSGWHVGLGMLTLVLLGGCHTLLPGDTGDLVSAGAKGPDELPARETAKICLTMAEAMEKNGRDREALILYEKARQQDPRRQLSRRLAVLYDRLGDDRQARAEYEQAVQAAPKDAGLLNDVGYFHYSRGNWSEAEKHLRQALAIDPKLQRASTNLGLTLGQQQRYADSLAAFTQAVGLAEAHCNLGFILTTQGKRSEAQQEYRRALTIAPDLQVARAALARLEGGAPADVRKPRPDRAVPPPAPSEE